jgi:hypothetical protein
MGTTIAHHNQPSRRVARVPSRDAPRWPAIANHRPAVALPQGSEDIHPSLAANRLKQHCTPVEVKELLLATGEYTDVDCARRIDAHSLK